MAPPSTSAATAAQAELEQTATRERTAAACDRAAAMEKAALDDAAVAASHVATDAHKCVRTALAALEQEHCTAATLEREASMARARAALPTMWPGLVTGGQLPHQPHQCGTQGVRFGSAPSPALQQAFLAAPHSTAWLSPPLITTSITVLDTASAAVLGAASTAVPGASTACRRLGSAVIGDFFQHHDSPSPLPSLIG